MAYLSCPVFCPFSAIAAAVVGVVLNLAVWFSMHTLFAEVIDRKYYGLRLQLPVMSTINLVAAFIAILACLLTFYWKKGLALTLGVSVVVGVVGFMVTGGR